MESSRFTTAMVRAASWVVAYTWAALCFSQPAAADDPLHDRASGADMAPTAVMPGLEAFVDGVVGAYMAEQKIAGVQVAVVKDGRALLVKGYGIDAIGPRRHVDPARSLFRLGSISKTFTWLSLLQLAERGRIDLDHPINDYLPDPLDIADDRFERPIRIVDLMNHTPGFEDVVQGLFVPHDAAPLPMQQQLRKYRPSRVREPGSFMVYSNYGVALAGAIVAQVSGMDFESYVERNIFVPLGMTNTTFREEYAAASELPEPMPAQLAQRRAQNLEWRNGAWRSYPHEHIVSMAPAGSAVSTAADMARYMNALLDPGRLERSGVLQQSTYSQLWEPTFQSAPGMPAMHHGFFNTPLGNNARLQFDNLSHGGATLHFMSFMVVIPDLSPRAQMSEKGETVGAAAGQGSLGIFITANSRPGIKLVQALPERILSQYYSAATVPDAAPPADAAARLVEYAGQYRSMRRSAQIMLGAATAWLAFVAAGIVWAAPLISADAQDLFVLGYPQSTLKLALVILLVAAGLTLLTLATLVPVWRDRNWSVGRRMRHSIAVAVLVALLITLLQWNLVGFKYF